MQALSCVNREGKKHDIVLSIATHFFAADEANQEYKHSSISLYIKLEFSSLQGQGFLCSPPRFDVSYWSLSPLSSGYFALCEKRAADISGIYTATLELIFWFLGRRTDLDHSLKANSHSSCQISQMLWNPKFHKSLPLGPILSWLNPVHTFPSL